MSDHARGPIDCDIHPSVPGVAALMPYLSGHWPEAAVERGFTDLESAMYPVNSALFSRADWRPAKGKAGSSLAQMQAQALDPFGVSTAICNCIYGVHMVFSADMAAAFAQAVNDWMVKEWLDKDARLRASIVIPLQEPQRAVDEIERCAADRRFVQVLMPVSGDFPLGNRFYWPIYAAAERLGLPVGVHAGSMYRHPASALGWHSYHVEDYSIQAQSFQSALASIISEGVFQKYPRLKMVFVEAGFTWLPACMWRLEKTWRGVRAEVPWVDRSPIDIIRRHIRFTLQPVDAPPTTAQLLRVLDQIGSDDMLLYSTDYPHWQFDGPDPVPDGLSKELVRKIKVDNPLATYGRLAETVAA